jgi:hypothetical protein
VFQVWKALEEVQAKLNVNLVTSGGQTVDQIHGQTCHLNFVQNVEFSLCFKFEKHWKKYRLNLMLTW